MAQQGGCYKTPVFHKNAVATGAGTLVSVVDGLVHHSNLGIQIKGIVTATVTFQGTIDGTNFEDVKFKDRKTGTEATTSTADGIFTCDVRGFLKIRANITAWTEGTININGILTAL